MAQYNFTGLGGFLGSQDPGGYSGDTTAGLMVTAEGLAHLGNTGAAPVGSHLKFNHTENNDRWASWVRGSLYISEFMTKIGYTTDDTAQTVTLSLDSNAMVKLNRPSESLLAEQCTHVLNYADLRADRGAEIVSQLGFPTEYFAMILGLHQAQHSKTIELITATQVMAAHIAMIVKNALAIRRPDQIDGRIMPMIPTPGHGAFPSAHATEAYAVNRVLSVLCEKWGSFADRTPRLAMMRGLAERIAVNRTVAGVHFPIDSWAGAVLGTAIGDAVLNLCGVANHDIPNFEYTAGDHDFSDAHNTFTISQGQNWGWLWAGALNETQNV